MPSRSAPQRRTPPAATGRAVRRRLGSASRRHGRPREGSESAASRSSWTVASTCAPGSTPCRVSSQTRSSAATSASTRPASSASTSTGSCCVHSFSRARSMSITWPCRSRRSSSFWEMRSAAECAESQSFSPMALLSALMSACICDSICGGTPWVSTALHACSSVAAACFTRSASSSAAASKAPLTALESAANSAGTGPGRLSFGDASDTASRSPAGFPVENSP